MTHTEIWKRKDQFSHRSAVLPGKRSPSHVPEFSLTGIIQKKKQMYKAVKCLWGRGGNAWNQREYEFEHVGVNEYAVGSVGLRNAAEQHPAMSLNFWSPAKWPWEWENSPREILFVFHGWKVNSPPPPETRGREIWNMKLRSWAAELRGLSPR